MLLRNYCSRVSRVRFALELDEPPKANKRLIVALRFLRRARRESRSGSSRVENEKARAHRAGLAS